MQTSKKLDGNYCGKVSKAQMRECLCSRRCCLFSNSLACAQKNGFQSLGESWWSIPVGFYKGALPEIGVLQTEFCHIAFLIFFWHLETFNKTKLVLLPPISTSNQLSPGKCNNIYLCDKRTLEIDFFAKINMFDGKFIYWDNYCSDAPTFISSVFHGFKDWCIKAHMPLRTDVFKDRSQFSFTF